MNNPTPNPSESSDGRAWPPARTRMLVILGVALAYFLTARLGLLLAMPGGHVTPVWPPTGIALAAVLLLGRRVWPGIWLGSFGANLLDFLRAPEPAVFNAFAVSAAIGAGAALAALIGEFLLRRYVGAESPLERVRNVSTFMAVGGVFSCLVSATNGVLALGVGGYMPWSAYAQTWLTWWLGDTAGVFVVTPLFLARGRPGRGRGWRHWLEGAVCFSLLVMMAYLIFIQGDIPFTPGRPFTFLLIPFLVWPAVRFGQRGAAVAALLIALPAVWGTAHGYGPFHLDTRNESLLVLELFLSVVTLTALCVAAVVTERNHLDAERQLVLQELERRVEQRTAELTHANARLRAIFDTEPECVKLLGPDGSLLEMNPAGLRMIEADTFRQVENHCIFPLVAEEHRAAFRELTEKVFHGESGALEFQIQSLKGNRRWLETHATPLRDEQGRVTALLGVTRDITESRQAESALRESEARIRNIFEQASDGIFLLSADNRYLDANPAGAAMLGYKREELLRMSVADVLAPAEIARLAVEPVEMMSGKPHLAEWEHRRKDGSIFPAEVSARRINDQTYMAVVRDLTVRKQAEAALRESEARLRHVLDGLGPHMFVGLLDLDGRVLHANRNPLEAAGLRLADVLGRPVADTYWFAYSGSVVERMRSALRRSVQGEAVRYDEQIRVAEGRLMWVDFSIQPLRDESGKIVFLVPSAVVINERKQAEEALRDNEERLRLALDASHMGTFDWDVPANRITWSRWHEELWGFQPGEFGGTYEAFAQRLHPDDLPAINAEIARCIAGRAPFSREFRVVWPDGSVHWIAGVGEFTFDATGQPVRMRGAVLETTDRRRAEEDLRASELRHRLMAEIIAGFAFAYRVSPDRKVTLEWATSPITQVTGYTERELQGPVSFRSLIHPDDRASQLAALERVLGGSPELMEFRLTTKSGAVRWLQCFNRPEWSDAGQRVVRILGATQDITARKEAEESVREAGERLELLSRRLIEVQEAERRHLARELHDEIGQTLTAAKINLQALQRFPDPASLPARLEKAVGLVDGLLQDVRKLSLNLRPPMLDDLGLVAGLRWLLDQRASSAGLQVRFEHDAFEERLEPALETACFRVAQEALTNVIRHHGKFLWCCK